MTGNQPPDRINLEELAALFDISLPTARKLVREDGFPVERAGAPGVAYEFDPELVRSWQAANEERLKREPCSRTSRISPDTLQENGSLKYRGRMAKLW